MRVERARARAGRGVETYYETYSRPTRSGGGERILERRRTARRAYRYYRGVKTKKET